MLASLRRGLLQMRLASILVVAFALALGLVVARISMDPDPNDCAAWNKLADAHLRQLSVTGDLTELTRASAAVQRSLSAAPPESNRGGLAMRARVELASHRFEEARRSAEQLRALMPDNAYPLQLLGDASLNLGEYADAARIWNEMLAAGGSSFATEPRFAQLDLVYGRVESARERLAAALELARQIVPASPEAVAWCQVQLGELAFKSGDWEMAGTQYDAALAAQPEYYAGLDHLAELRGAQGRLDEAVALYKRVIDRVPRPDLQQALGDLYLFAGHAADARPWHERALAGYLASVKRSEVLQLHHLAGLYADSLNEPAKSVECARRDLTLRHSIQAYDALAWALHKAGKLDEARETMAKALATGTRDAHILYHAGMIRMGAGDITGGSAALQQALAANPRYNTFHVHR